MPTPSLLALLITVAVIAQPSAPTPRAILDRYIEAIGGEAALRAIKTRVTEGRFSNDRGMNTRMRIYETAPNQRVTLVGTDAIESERGSGRGFDGTVGWDKSYIGTGLRTVTGAELTALSRESDMLRPLKLLDDCASVSSQSGADEDVIACKPADAAEIRFHFDRRSGLLVKQETPTASGGTVTVLFDDYRTVDGVRLPFRTRVHPPGASVTFTTDSVRHNVAVDGRVYTRPPT